jgi:phage terminase large subunit-like protein
MKKKSKKKVGRPRKDSRLVALEGRPGRTNRQLKQYKNENAVDFSQKKEFIPFNFKFKGDKASRVIAFFKKYLTHTKGIWEGKKFKLLDWQIELIQKLFGTLKSNGSRQLKTCYCSIGKKNGKSELASGLALYLLVADDEGGPEVILAAADREQASIIFNVCSVMVKNNKKLSRSLKVTDSIKRILYPHRNGVLKVVSREAFSKHGLNISGCIIDELHAQPDRELFDVLTKGSGAARKQPIYLFLTTAGFDRKKSICGEVDDYAHKVKEGIIEDKTFLPVVYEVPEDADWENEENWKLANPSLGKIFDIENLREDYRKAKEVPTEENNFRRFRLNQWTKQETRWLSMAFWDACGGIVDPEALRGRTCYGGLDLATTIDIAAYVLLFPPVNGEAYSILPFFFVPEDTIKIRVKKDRVPYDVWVRQKYITATPGNIIDYSWIEATIKQTVEKYDVKEIGYDRWGATALVTDMVEEGLTMIPIGMGFASQSGPTKEMEKLIMGGKINHGNNPVLRWNFDNVSIKTDPAGNKKLDKEKSRDKIDGLVAMVLALDRALRHGAGGKSVYETRGILSVGSDKAKEEEKPREEVPEIKPIPTKAWEEKSCPKCGRNFEGDESRCKRCGRFRDWKGVKNGK